MTKTIYDKLVIEAQYTNSFFCEHSWDEKFKMLVKNINKIHYTVSGAKFSLFKIFYYQRLCSEELLKPFGTQRMETWRTYLTRKSKLDMFNIYGVMNHQKCGSRVQKVWKYQNYPLEKNVLGGVTSPMVEWYGHGRSWWSDILGGSDMGRKNSFPE